MADKLLKKGGAWQLVLGITAWHIGRSSSLSKRLLAASQRPRAWTRPQNLEGHDDRRELSTVPPL